MKTATGAEDNPTRRFIAETVAQGGKHVSLHINPAFTKLDAFLIGGAPGDVRVRFSIGANLLHWRARAEG
jgi:hypothetical protein